MILAVLLAGCVAAVEDAAPTAAVADGMTAEELQGWQESQQFAGETGPYLPGQPPMGQTNFTATFGRPADVVTFAFTLDRVPPLFYSLYIRNGDGELLADYDVADNPNPILQYLDTEGPYEVEIRPWATDIGFRWEANVTQAYHPAANVTPEELAALLERRSRSDNETVFWNGSSPLVGRGSTAPTWTSELRRPANYTIIELALNEPPTFGNRVVVRIDDEVLWDWDLRDGPLHGILSDIPGPYELELVPALGEPDFSWRSAVTQFYTEEPESNWSLLGIQHEENATASFLLPPSSLTP